MAQTMVIQWAVRPYNHDLFDWMAKYQAKPRNSEAMKTSDSQLKSYVITWRRRFHAAPELSFKEALTSKAIAGELKRLGWQVKTGVGKTGVVGLLNGKTSGKTVALRADMDALPVQEENDVPYRSRVLGQMHACGHDGHCAMLLGAASLLAKNFCFSRARRRRRAGRWG
jgi:metal-dependent amidase/aminoacylase/carboxypeptidase family protein